MKWQASLCSLLLLASPALAQDFLDQTAAVSAPPVFAAGSDITTPSGFLVGDRGFPNFIGFVSNAQFALDPRALTQLWPVFANDWSHAIGPLIPGGDTQVYGPGLSVALSDRFEIGINRGGYAVSDLRKFRDGFLDTGGFAQYTLIRDVPDQFLLSVGLSVLAPTGEADVFAGHGPAYLTPYLTVGKEFGDFHVLATTGYNFPAASGTATTETYYASVHFDRQTFGWLYPLVEFNGAWSSTNINLNLPQFLPEFFNLDQHPIAGGIVTVAPGVNAVLMQDRLEVGLVYETPIYSQRNIHFDEVLLKIVLRY
jgi:hypothetical protein